MDGLLKRARGAVNAELSSTGHKSIPDHADSRLDAGKANALLKTGALQKAIFNSANFSSIATDAKGVIQIFNVGAARMLGYAAAEVVNRITPADISDPLEVIARATEGFLRISVIDSGIGTSAEGLERLFKPFSQIDAGLSRKFEGTGSDWQWSKCWPNCTAARWAVESALGEGSCFTVWLPLRVSETEVISAKAPAAPPVRPAETAGVALVVEDDFKAAELIRVQLESEGFKVLHAGSAEAALVLAIQQPLSLITLDILLPNMDGWEFLGRIKQVPELRNIPVVILSIVADANKGFSLGAAAVMQKPISRLELYEALVGLSLFPRPKGKNLRVLIADDDPNAVELIALRVSGMAGTVLRAYGGREPIEVARRELPDVIVLDLMMPEVNGFDLVAARNERTDTADVPVLVVTSKHITAEDRASLTRYVATIMEKAGFDSDLFTSEIRRAMSGRRLLAA